MNEKKQIPEWRKDKVQCPKCKNWYKSLESHSCELNKYKRIVIRVRKEQKKEIEDYCNSRDLSISRFGREAIFERMRKTDGSYNNTLIQELKEKINDIKESIDKKEKMKKEIEGSIEFTNHETQVKIIENIVREQRKTPSYRSNKTLLSRNDIIKKAKIKGLDRDVVIGILRYSGKFNQIGSKGEWDLKDE